MSSVESQFKKAFSILNKFVNRLGWGERTRIKEMAHVLQELDPYFKYRKGISVTIVSLYVSMNETLIMKRGRHGGVFKGEAPVSKSTERQKELALVREGIFVTFDCPFCGAIVKGKVGYGSSVTYKCNRCKKTFQAQRKETRRAA